MAIRALSPGGVHPGAGGLSHGGGVPPPDGEPPVLSRGAGGTPSPCARLSL